jgi:ribosome-binding factor A
MERFDNKLSQLCEQIAEAIGYALACECADPLLSQLVVASVEPAPSIRRVRVTVYPPLWGEDFDAALVSERLERARGFLRSEVAFSIHRKRTPELVLQLVHPDQVLVDA